MRTKTIAIGLLAAACCTASGQFFSADEKATSEKKRQDELRTNLSEEEQKAVYLELCEAFHTAEDKALQMYPVRIHQTPEVRKAQQDKAEKTRQTLLAHYKDEIAKQHQVGREYLDRIESNGRQEKWPEKRPPAPAQD